MKIILFSTILLGTIFCASAQWVTNQPAHLPFKVIYFEGKTNSGVSGTLLCPTPDAISFGSEGADTVTSPGHESDLRWKFIGRNGDKDIYQFTFSWMTKTGNATTSKEVQFEGKRIIVFEDKLHTVVMESPDAEDLKKAQGH